MNAPRAALTDEAARVTAMTAHDRSLLVEAGAGSGKTAVMAGRVALLLASGAEPGSIAAVTFTELAASELLGRVRDFAEALLEGEVPVELRPALPDGLSEPQRDALEGACRHLDEINCSTIHGFCQRLIKPYPAEADIDPGATVLDPVEADLLFDEVVEDWLRENLGGGEGTLLAELVYRSPSRAIALVRRAAGVLRGHRDACTPPAEPLEPLIAAFTTTAAEFRAFVGTAGAQEDETVRIAECFGEMSDAVAEAAAMAGAPASLVRILTSAPHPELCTTTGSFRKYQKKGKWQAAAKVVGLPKADADGLNDRADALHTACCESWGHLLEAAAVQVLHELLDLARPIAERFRERKRTAARLDFDDLIVAARDLLRRHPAVRVALAQRFSHVLVDEFQDTDPVQTEIFWRLCGEPTDADTEDWRTFAVRPGALFLVGDSKQAIYRFRGADVAAYLEARQAFLERNPDDVLSISTNFRSCGSILSFVNERFEPHLSADGQPGFTSLDPFHPDWEPGPCVAALDVACADEDGKANAEIQRDCEAEAVAELCARLIGSHMVVDRRAGGTRPCRPGDIALLAPTGADLWRYEEALERRGVPVSTQAGKGLYRRQEVQDLIAITRVLADGRDTLALAALLRGPLVGLTEEQLLDLVWAQPRDPEAPDLPPRLWAGIDAEHVVDPIARDVIAKLQVLRMRVNSTTPYQLLSEAVDSLRVRPMLIQRHGLQAERPLANVDLFLSLARAYAGRGLCAFSDAMRFAWEDASRAPEGRPDAQEEAVALFTIHAAKGLEWPIVMPINTMTKVTNFEEPIIERGTDRVYMPVMGVAPPGYSEIREAELQELERERQRLWYVAATRARELLVLPRLDVGPGKGSWGQLVDLRLAEVASIDASDLPPGFDPAAADPANGQTREVFADEAARIVEATRQLSWLAPSRDENPAGPLAAAPEPSIVTDEESPADTMVVPQGSRLRGLVIHKLLEEVLTGELEDEPGTVGKRAEALLRELGAEPQEDAGVGPSPAELAECVSRALALPEIVAVRERLVPEMSVYDLAEGGSVAVYGIADAIALGDGGVAELVVDWKSDVAPDPVVIDHYRLQVDSYRKLVGARRGLVVFVTTGSIEAVGS